MTFDDEEELLDNMREEKASLKTVLNKKKVSKWELDEALIGEV